MDRRRMAFGLLGDTLGTEDILNTPIRRGGILPVTEYPDRTEFDLSSGLTGALMDAFTAPARAARGEISESDMVPEAFNFAGSLTLGSLLAPRPTGSVGMGGKPIRGYHGTNRQFDKFKPSEDGNVGPGVYLSASPEEAATYGRKSLSSSSPSIIPVDIKGKLASVDDYESAYSAARASTGSASEARAKAVEALRAAGFDGVETSVGGVPNYTMFKPGTVYSATTGDLMFANAKTGAAVPLATRALEAQQPKGITAFHGSPHDFDKFSMDKIGTGEGAQAYGHGLYFAEAEDVARSYRDALSGMNFNGQHLTTGDTDWHIMDAARKAAPISQRDADFISTNITDSIRGGFDLKKLRSDLLAQRDGNSDFTTALDAALAAAEKATKHPGHMYEVRINADPADFLDWDKPLSEQPQVARKLGFSTMSEDAINSEALRLMDEGNKAAGRQGGWMDDPAIKARIDELQSELDNKVPNVTGANFYRGSTDDDFLHGLLTRGNSLSERSAELKKAGIPGIRYLDQMSRGEGKGSSNYVVFDDALIEIMRKYGLLGPVAGLGAAGLLADDGGQVY